MPLLPLLLLHAITQVLVTTATTAQHQDTVITAAHAMVTTAHMVHAMVTTAHMAYVVVPTILDQTAINLYL